MKKLWLVVILALLLAFALRVMRLDDKAVWWDEAWSVTVAQQSLEQTTYFTAADVHPPLYQWALHGWLRAGGISLFAARYLSLLWGMLTLALIFTLARRIGGNRAALWALFFAATAAFLVRWSQETRMYAQAAALTTLTAYLYVRAFPLHNARIAALPPPAIVRRVSKIVYRRAPTPPPMLPAPAQTRRALWPSVLLGIAAASVALTHYLGVLVLLILALHYVLTARATQRTPRDHMRFLGALILAAALIGLWMLYALPLTRSGSAGADADPALVFQLSVTLLTAGTSLNLNVYALPALTVTLSALIGLGFASRRRPSAVLLVMLFALIPPLVIYTLGILQTRFYAPKPEERYLIIFAPLLYVGLGMAVSALYRQMRLLGLLAAFVLTVFYGAALLREADARYLRDEYATLFETLHALAQPDEPVVFVSGDRYPLVYYHLNRAAGGQTPLTVRDLPPFDAGGADNVTRLVGDAPRFWFVAIEPHFQDPQGGYRAALDAQYARAFHADIDHNALTLYTRDESDAAPNGASVLTPIREARAGDMIRVGGADGLRIACDGHTLAQAEQGAWTLLQARVYPAYPNADCVVTAGTRTHTLRITHNDAQARTPSHTVNADFGALTLVGYDVRPPDPTRGGAFEVTLTWRVDERTAEDVTVFAQLIGPFREDGPLWSSADGWPMDTPTSRLWEGLTFSETRRLNVPHDMPAGDVQIYVGLYRLETGERLLLPDGADAVVMEGLRVRD